MQRRQIKVSPHLFHCFFQKLIFSDVEETKGGTQGTVGGSLWGECQKYFMESWNSLGFDFAASRGA